MVFLLLPQHTLIKQEEKSPVSEREHYAMSESYTPGLKQASPAEPQLRNIQCVFPQPLSFTKRQSCCRTAVQHKVGHEVLPC